MTPCEQCAGIDPALFLEDCDDYDSDDRLPLKNSWDMSQSAHDGCEGCQFFLGLIAQRANDPEEMDAFINRAASITIDGHLGAWLEADWRPLSQQDHRPLVIGLNLCLADGKWLSLLK